MISGPDAHGDVSPMAVMLKEMPRKTMAVKRLFTLTMASRAVTWMLVVSRTLLLIFLRRTTESKIRQRTTNK